MVRWQFTSLELEEDGTHHSQDSNCIWGRRRCTLTGEQIPGTGFGQEQFSFYNHILNRYPMRLASAIFALRNLRNRVNTNFLMPAHFLLWPHLYPQLACAVPIWCKNLRKHLFNINLWNRFTEFVQFWLFSHCGVRPIIPCP